MRLTLSTNGTGLRHQTVDVTDDTNAFFTQMGKLALLIGTTPNFARVQMDLGLSLIHGALMNRSYCLYVDDAEKPVAGLIWAHINEEVREFYLDHGILPDPEAWRSGKELWLLNVVAPGGLIKPIFKDTMSTLFKDETEAFMLRPSPSGKRRVVRITHKGTQVVRTLPAASSPDAQDAPQTG